MKVACGLNVFVADRAETYLAPVIPGEISLIQNLLLIFIIAGLVEKSDDILFGFVKCDGSGKLFPAAIGIFAACVGFTVITIGTFIFYYDNFPLVELLACHKQIDRDLDNTPRIPYSTFKKMYKLHPENFQFIDNECLTFYSFRYRGKRFSLNFLDFVRALSLIDEHITEKDLARERAKRIKKYEEQSKLYAMMRDDLASDLATIEKQKTDAYDKIKTSTDNINDIANRLIKEAH